MKLRIGNVVFEDFTVGELDIVIDRLRRAGLLQAKGSEEEPAPTKPQKPLPVVNEQKTLDPVKEDKKESLLPPKIKRLDEQKPLELPKLPKIQKQEKKEESKGGWL